MKKKVRSKLFNGEKLSFLPEGVLHNIMSRLPIKSLKRFECAGKSLCNLIRSNLFIEDHINQMTQNGKLLLTVHYLQGNHTLSFHGLDSANLEKVQPDVSIPFPESVIEDAEENLILGPCNGCLCIIGGERKQVDVEYDDERDAREHIVIFDLTSQNFDNLPLCRISCPPCCSDSLCGAGFGISSSGTIKIVLIREIDDEDKPYLLVNVYDSSTHSWDESQPRGFPCPSTVGGLFLNGACHWDMYNNTYSSILHFDIEKECFKKMKYPDVLMKTYFNERKFLTILNGCLTVIRHKLEATPAYDIWVMKEYNRNSSWSKQFVLKPGFVISPLCWMHNGCLLVRDYGEKKLRCIEPLTSGAKDIQLDGGTETLQKNKPSCAETLKPHFRLRPASKFQSDNGFELLSISATRPTQACTPSARSDPPSHRKPPSELLTTFQAPIRAPPRILKVPVRANPTSELNSGQPDPANIFGPIRVSSPQVWIRSTRYKNRPGPIQTRTRTRL